MNTFKMLVFMMISALFLPAFGNEKHPVERPFIGHADAFWVINLVDGSSTVYQVAETSHFGRIILTGSANWDLATMIPVSGQGEALLPTGEKTFWVIDPTGVVITTGGTGRYEHLTGIASTIKQTDPIITIDPVAMTMTMTFSYVAAGTVTY